MTTVEQFIKNIDNNKKISKFLTEEEQCLFNRINYKTFFPLKCERKRVIINDENMSDVLLINNYISIIKVGYNKKYGEISHRDVLGSLIGLGIKRDCIGDIIIGDEIYFFVIKEMEYFIINNLITIGKVSVNLKLAEYDEIKNLEIDNYIEDKMIVSSRRLDTIISVRCCLSREKAKTYINLKNVKINGVVNTNPDYVVKIDDLISIHKFGRLIVKEELNKTKKDKYVLRVLKTK